MGWYYSITEEMINAGLSGNELLVYALVAGYSQSELGCYYGKLDVTAYRCGITTRTANHILSKLTGEGWIIKGKAVIYGDWHITYKVNEGKIFLGKNFQDDRKNFPTETENISTYNKEDIKEVNKDTCIQHARETFVIPSLDEVRQYCIERANGIDAEAFVDHYTSNGWMVGRTKMKDWKAAVRNWEKSHKQYDRQPRQAAPSQPKNDWFHNNIEVGKRLGIIPQNYGK